ncbi:MAG: dihydropteroate synthase [Planctomycetes bacterium]|nr:dihydropteroate synthase [Planctomycetota bacterium]
MTDELLLPGRRRLSLTERPLVMGILNITSDSFYDGGRYLVLDKALKYAESMLDAGADIIDVGGESTRPGADAVDASEEAERVIPVIRAIREKWLVPVSVDTYKAEVAKQALEAGADIINDISGLRFDKAMLKVAKASEAPLVVMHIQGTPKDMQKDPHYDDVVAEVRRYFQERYDTLTGAGIDASRIVFDPGIGFGKRLEHNLALISRLDELVVEGRPIMVGASRKSFIGSVLDKDVEDRMPGSVAVAAIAVFMGASIVRVHDIAATLQAVRMGMVLRAARAKQVEGPGV